MNCPSCDGKNREDARFCKFCGTDLLSRCRMCGAILDEDARFCDACGTPVEERPAAGPAPTPTAAAARKVVTVLFADLSGSTALEERMDAESVRSILDRFYAAMRAEVERHSGRVVKFTGDGVMAAFGVPEVHEDDASRAIDAALAMREELVQLANDLQLDVALNIGVNTGEVVVSETDDDVVGDAVNVAARLEGAATGGEILVGEETWRLTRASSRYEAVEPLTLKGKAEPVPAYRLLSVDERTADSAAAPFVGREAELGRLLTAFQDCVDANAARLVTIIGSPGLGKTRLARELMSELADTARIRETRCDPAGASTFAPITDALRAGSEITETSSEEEIVAALAARLPEDDPDRDRVAKLSAALFGVGVSGTTEETFWALRRLIEAAAHQQPVVFVIDDVHWAEPLLLDLVEHLAEWIRDAPVLLVGTARPELRDLRPSLAEGGRAADVIALEGLDRAATAQLALNLLGADELPAELLAKIPASTEGNPLFVRELVRMLVDDGVLQRTSDGWSVTVDVDAIEVPPTISSLLSARVDRLRNDERTVVELASVVGKEFYRGALVDLAPPGVADLVDGCLESLRRKELVEPVGTYWIDEPVYRFHHVLIRDAAYRRLLKESRADLHERVSVWLERKTTGVLGEHDELVGYHLEQAHEYKQQLGRPDDALGSRAAGLLGDAAQRALESDDLPSAATLSGRALDRLAADDTKRSELLLIRCEALLSMGEVAQGTAALSEFERVADTPRLRAWATCFAGALANLSSQVDSADIEARVSAAGAELAALGDQAGAAKAHIVHAETLASRGRFAECEAILDQALTAARAANDRRRITATLGFAPHAALWGPNPVSRAGGRCLDIVRLLRITTGSPAVEATSLRCQAVLEAMRGRAEASRRMLRSARRTLTELGLEHELLDTEAFAGWVELYSGEPAAAADHLRTAYDGFLAAGHDIAAARSASALARAHLALGEVDEARALIERVEALNVKDLNASIAFLSVKAELLAHSGDVAGSRRMAEDAIELASQTDALIDHGNACRSLATVLRAAGDAAGAKAAEDRALALFERKGATALIVGAERVGAELSPPERAATEASALPPVVLHIENASTRRLKQYAELFARRAWSELLAISAPDGVMEDRRVGMSWVVVGANPGIDSLKAMADMGTVRLDVEPLATRGERLSLNRYVARGRGSGGFETELLLLVEVDAQERVAALIVFSADDLDAAIAELDERYILGEGSQAAQIVRMWAGFHQRYNARDWAALREQLADDFVAIDHRLVSLGQMDADAYVRAMQGLIDLDPGRSGVTASIAVSDGDGGVATFVTNGMTSDGVLTAETMHMVAAVVDGRFARHEFYPMNQLEPALRRFDELTAAQRAPGSVMLANAATVTNDRIGHALAARDWAAIERLVSENVVFVDRRRGLQHEAHGRGAFMELMKAIPTIGTYRFGADVLAVRGDRHMLAHLTTVGPDGRPTTLQTQFLSVQTCDAQGRLVRMTNLDPDDFDGAWAELERLFVADRGSEVEGIVAAWRVFAAAHVDHDWDAMRALLHDDFVLVDHRPAAWGALHGADAYRAVFDSAADVLHARKMWPARYLRSAEGRALTEARIVGVGADEVDVDVSRLALSVVLDGKLMRIEYFPLDRLAEAIVRFDELGLRADVASPLDNAAMRVNERAVEATMRADAEAAIELYSPDARIEDRRRGLRAVFERDSFTELGQASREAFSVRAYRCIATRGDRLALARGTWRTSDPGRAFEAEVLRLSELDESGRLKNTIFWDAEDLDVALTELDERYATGEGADHAEAIRFSAALAHATNDPTGNALRPLTHEDVVLVDHRPASFGEVSGLDEFLRLQGSWSALFDVRHAFVSRRIAEAPGRALGETRIYGTSREGAPIDTSRLVLAVFDEKVSRIEYFPLDQEAQALARFHELGPRADVHALENAASRFVRRLGRSMTGTLEEFLALHAPSFTLDDRRAGLRHVTRGLDELRQYWVSAQREGLGRVRENEVIAIRGERLVLSRRLYRATDDAVDFETEQLVIDEIDETGRVSAAVFFDPHDIDAAFDELDARFLAGEGADAAAVVDLCARLISALNARDWAGVRGMLTDDLVVSDHRPASLGVMGPDEYIASQKPLYEELVPDFRLRSTRVLAFAADRLVVVLRGFGTRDGADVEISLIGLAVARNGRFSRIEFFPLEQVDLALERSDELGPRPDVASPPPLENLATRTWDAMCVTFAERRWDAHAQRLAEDVVSEDRRPGLRNTQTGRRAFIDVAKLIASFDPVLQTDVIAVRGDRLALFHETYIPAADDPRNALVEIVNLVEVDADGLVVRTSAFEPEAVDDAFDELDRCFLAGEGSIHAKALRIVFEQAKAYNARDWTAYTAVQADDHVFVDHRPAGAGTLVGGPAQVRYLQGLMELAPDVGGRIVEVARVASDRVLTRLPVRGTTHDGAVIEMAMYVLYVLRDGRICRQEAFPIEGRDAALERFGELGPHPDAPALENAAVRRIRMVIRAFGLRDWDFFIEHFPDDHVYIDRRAGLQTTFRGREQAIENLRQAAANGANKLGFETVAIRGARLVLGRYRWVASEWDVDVLVLDEHDDRGRAIRSVVFDPTDLDAAFTELDERFIAGEGAAGAEYVRLGAACAAAISAGDWDRYRTLLSDDVVIRDHRPASMGELSSADEFVRGNRTLGDLMGGLRADIVDVIRASGTAGVSRLSVRGRNDEGGDVELDAYIVGRFDDGKLASLDYFPLDRLDDALARFERSARSGGQDDHPCVRWMKRRWQLVADGDWDATIDMFRADVVFEDHRHGLRARVEGRTNVLAHARTISDVTAAFRPTLLATRGNRLALVHAVLELTGGYDVELLLLSELDDDDRQSYNGVFGPDDIETAMAVLDRLYAAGEGAPYAEILNNSAVQREALRSGDWARYAGLIDADVVLVDNRPASLGEVHGRDEVVRVVRALAPLVGGVRPRAGEIHAIAADRMLMEAIASGTSEHGGEVEMRHLRLQQWRDGRIVRIEMFPDSDIDRARARFDALGPQGVPGRSLENACTRHYESHEIAWNATDWDAMAGQIRPDVVVDDRRVGVANMVVGADDYLRNARVISGLGAALRTSTAAIRGERLALLELDWYDPSALSASALRILHVNELHEDGRLSRIVVFDPEDRDAAFAELEERFIEGEGREAADAMQLGLRTVPVWNGQDWEALEAVLAPDYVFIDHRPVTTGELDANGVIEIVKAGAELMADVHHEIVAVPRWTRDMVLAEVVNTATNTGGGRVETAYLQIVCSSDGRFTRMERFAPDRYDDAVSRFEELAAQSRSGMLDNACMRTTAHFVRRVIAREWEQARRIISDGFVGEDRRSGLGYNLGAAELIEMYRAMHELGLTTFDVSGLATRGECIALMRVHVGATPESGEEFTVELLALNELAEAGSIVGSVLFDLDDEDAAFAELDERYAGTLSGPEAELVRSVPAFFDAYNARDWDRFGDFIHRDFVLIDHLAAAIGRIEGREDYVAYLRTMTELVPDARVRIIRDFALAPGTAMYELRLRGTSTDGVAVETAWIDVPELVDGRVKRLDQYPIDAIESARSRFDEIRREELLRSRDHTPPLANEMTRHMESWTASWNRGEWDPETDLISETIVTDDRRSGLQYVLVGREAHIANLAAVRDIGAALRPEIIAIRGERLALFRFHWFDPTAGTDAIVEHLQLSGLDEHGRAALSMPFDLDDLDAAYAELDERYAETLDPRAATVVRHGSELLAAYNARDFERFRSLMVDELEVIDHRPVGTGAYAGADRFVDANRVHSEVIENYRFRVIDIPEVADGVCLTRNLGTGTNSEGGAIELPSWGVWSWNAGARAFDLFEYFPLDTFDAARARFRELLSLRLHAESRLENEAFRALRLLGSSVMDGDWDGVTALVADEAVWDDRRRGFGWRWEGKVEVLRQLKAATPTRGRIVETAIATRGERLVLDHQRVVERSFEVEFTALYEIDATGLVTACVLFDVADLDGAFAELDERYAVTLPPIPAQIARISADLFAAFNHRDWDRYRSHLAPDFVAIDRQNVGAGEIAGPDAMVAYAKGIIELLPNAREDLIAFHRIDDLGAVAEIRARGQNAEGGDVEFALIYVGLVADGLGTRMETYPADRLDEAIARYDELTAG